MTDEYNQLKKDNETIREALNEICYLNNIKNDEYNFFWKTINLLIYNELEQEKFCNQ